MDLRVSLLRWVQDHTILRRAPNIAGTVPMTVSDNEAVEEIYAIFEEHMGHLMGHDRTGQDHLEEMVVLAADRDRYVDVVVAAAKLNCAKPPYGKHYKDPVYCGDCTSCRARATLEGA